MCRRDVVTHEVVCKRCDGKYVGETSRNAFTSGLDHKSDLRKKNARSLLHLHNVEKQDLWPAPGFEMHIIAYACVFGRDATKRQVRESVLIKKTEEEKLINNTSEDRWSCHGSCWVCRELPSENQGPCQPSTRWPSDITDQREDARDWRGGRQSKEAQLAELKYYNKVRYEIWI